MSSLSAGRLSPGSSSLPGTTLLHLVKARGKHISTRGSPRAFPRSYPFSLFPAFQEFSCFIFLPEVSISHFFYKFYFYCNFFLTWMIIIITFLEILLLHLLIRCVYSLWTHFVLEMFRLRILISKSFLVEFSFLCLYMKKLINPSGNSLISPLFR